ncbi:MAG: FAD-dependent oxidoreductase [Clostridiales bacterium]|jgi:NADH dehydrogenase|nr:FAD-dependent oxidoreductase [Clostridiales bacterium]
MSKRIVILGAGYAGLEAAKTLHKKLKKQDDVEITLIDQNSYHTLLTELHEVAGQRVEPDSVKVSIQHVLQYTKVKFVQDRITDADLKAKKLFSQDKEYEFDYLIAGFGSEPAFFDIPGIEENAFTLWSLEDAEKLHDHILNMFRKASEEKDPARRKAMLTLAVGGGGYTGVELVGEFIEWVKILCKQYNIDRKEVRLIIVEALPTVLPILNNKLKNKAVRYMEKHGVEILVNSPIVKVDPDSFTIKDGTVIPTKTLVWTGGIQTSSFVKKLGLSVGRRNRIIVNEYCQTLEYPYVYAVGDNMQFTDEKGEVLPPLVETALQSGHTAAVNIAAEILGKEKEVLKPKLHGVMVSVGSSYAVAQLEGMPLLSGIFAIIIKHLVNMHYLFGIGGLELCWKYIGHQFLKNSRKYNFFLQSVLSHARERSFRFWLVPLRIYLGYKWLLSGLDKINNNWWTEAVIGASDATGGATASGATAAADAATAATAEGGLMSLISDHTPDWYAWFVETVVYPNNMLFQRIIVITEIALGIAFILGIFTFLAAIVSIGMNLNFLLSTGLYDWWFIWASFAMLAGAGRVLGADHYLMPWLTHQLRYFQRNRRIHLFKGWRW